MPRAAAVSANTRSQSARGAASVTSGSNRTAARARRSIARRQECGVDANPPEIVSS